MVALDAAKLNRPCQESVPWVLVEAQVYEKFGWAPEQLDRMDSDRVLRAQAALGIRDRAIHVWQQKETAKQRKK